MNGLLVKKAHTRTCPHPHTRPHTHTHTHTQVKNKNQAGTEEKTNTLHDTEFPNTLKLPRNHTELRQEQHSTDFCPNHSTSLCTFALFVISVETLRGFLLWFIMYTTILSPTRLETYHCLQSLLILHGCRSQPSMHPSNNFYLL